jgi:hypothetical protein
MHFDERQRGIKRSQDFSNGIDDGLGPRMRAHVQSERIGRLGVSPQDSVIGRLHGLAKGTILGVGHHANDFHVAIRWALHRPAESSAQRVLRREKMKREGLVDHHRTGLQAPDVGGGEESAGDQTEFPAL